MKKRILNLCFVLLLSFFTPIDVLADAWDNLTIDEAKAVVAELEKNPFIFDYCDCCDHSGEYASRVHLLKVTSTEIVSCSWDQNFYSVRIGYIILGELKYSSKGPKTKKLKAYTDGEIMDLIYMNYTWTFDRSTSLAAPFFESVPYSSYPDHRESCKKKFAYPTPAAVAKVSDDADYAAWYQRTVGNKQ